MSENSTPEERTEDPTATRWDKLREQGQIYQSKDLSQTVSLIVAFLTLTSVLSWLGLGLQQNMMMAFELIGRKDEMSSQSIISLFLKSVEQVGLPILILLLVTAVSGVLAVGLQTGFNVKKKKIDFRFNLLNPIGGFRRIFSIMGFVNVLKAIAKLGLILPVAFFALKAFVPQLIDLAKLTLPEIGRFTIAASKNLFWKIAAILIPLAIGDFFYGRYRWYRQNRMTKNEVKDERKAVDGDEGTRRKIKAKGLARIAQRISEAVPKADVIITNPTHFAVALKYDTSVMPAPYVLAKGQGHIALRIREIAKENRVPIVERKEIARALYASTEVGAQIPYELFTAVANIIAYVYRLKGKTL